jgi:hypothetical protein
MGEGKANGFDGLIEISYVHEHQVGVLSTSEHERKDNVV